MGFLIKFQVVLAKRTIWINYDSDRMGSGADGDGATEMGGSYDRSELERSKGARRPRQSITFGGPAESLFTVPTASDAPQAVTLLADCPTASKVPKMRSCNSRPRRPHLRKSIPSAPSAIHEII